MLRHLVVTLACLAPSLALAGEPTKEACVDAHSRGQDAQDQGKLVLARTLFLSCAQASCPAAVQADCARFVENLMAQQPTVVFVARDEHGNDLPDTQVHIDGVLAIRQLDGKPFDVDPGKHVLRFSHRGRDETVTVVIGSAEKARRILVTFGRPQRVTAFAPPPSPARSIAAHRVITRHPGAALPIAITGSLVMVGGAAIGYYGASQIPSRCSLATHECSAPPGDPVFAQASTGARMLNLGLLVGGVGAAALVGGLIWYAAGGSTTKERATRVAPLVGSDGGGVAVRGRF